MPSLLSCTEPTRSIRSSATMDRQPGPRSSTSRSPYHRASLWVPSPTTSPTIRAEKPSRGCRLIFRSPPRNGPAEDQLARRPRRYENLVLYVCPATPDACLRHNQYQGSHTQLDNGIRVAGQHVDRDNIMQHCLQNMPTLCS